MEDVIRNLLQTKIDDTSELTNLAQLGILHSVKIDGGKIAALRAECKRTSPYEPHFDIHRTLHPDLVNLMNQNYPLNGMTAYKLADGYVFRIQSSKDCSPICCVVEDNHLCEPVVGENVSNHYGGECVIHSVVMPPVPGSFTNLLFAPYDNGVLAPNVIPGLSTVEHVLQKIKAMAPLSDVPRPLYSTKCLGTLNGVNLKGENAHAIKNTFMRLIDKTGGQNMYDVPIKLPVEISKLLGLNNPDGLICCAPLKNGIIGYRNRKCDDAQTLIFVCNCDDFFQEKPNPVEKSTLQHFKMVYSNKTKDGLRIVVDTTGKETKGTRCTFGTPVVTLDMCVQDVLNVIEFAMRNASLQDRDCLDFPKYILQNIANNTENDKGRNNGNSGSNNNICSNNSIKTNIILSDSRQKPPSF